MPTSGTSRRNVGVQAKARRRWRNDLRNDVDYRVSPRRNAMIVDQEAHCQMENNVGFDRITFDPKILGGRACIRGMRIPVSVIVGQVAHGVTLSEILRDYPDLEEADIRQALEYAAWLTQEEVHRS